METGRTGVVKLVERETGEERINAVDCGGRYRIGDWVFAAETGEVWTRTSCRRLEPRVSDVLRLLADHPGEVVSRAHLFDRVWKDRVVVDEALTRAISRIRVALGDAGSPRRYVETLPKRGYRLIASVRPSCERPSFHGSDVPPA